MNISHSRAVSHAVLLAIIFVSHPVFVSGAPVQGPTGNYYEYLNGPLRWVDAHAAAAVLSFNGIPGHLVTIASQEEQDFVYDQVIQAQGFAWAGANDLETEGVWKWVAGPEAGTIFWNQGVEIGYNNWASFPNNNGAGEHHMMLNWPVKSSKAWNDAGAVGLGGPYGYVVEYSVLPGPSTLIEAIGDLIDDGVLNRGQGNSLLVKLNSKGNERATLNSTEALIHHVNAFLNGGVLTPSEGQPLIDMAQAIIDSADGVFELGELNDFPEPFVPVSAASIPEPSAILLTLFALACVTAWRKRV